MTLEYRWLHETVRKRFASDAAMEAFLPQALSADDLSRKSDGRYLSAMTQRVFQAGMQHFHEWYRRSIGPALEPEGKLETGSA